MFNTHTNPRDHTMRFTLISGVILWVVFSALAVPMTGFLTIIAAISIGILHKLNRAKRLSPTAAPYSEPSTRQRSSLEPPPWASADASDDPLSRYTV